MSAEVLPARQQINEDLKHLIDISSKICLIVNPDKSQMMLFGRSVASNKVKVQVSIFWMVLGWN
nr:unnamed protein product [Callosobruchus chinensis]